MKDDVNQRAKVFLCSMLHSPSHMNQTACLSWRWIKMCVCSAAVGKPRRIAYRSRAREVLVVILAVKRLSVVLLWVENIVHTLEAAGAWAWITFARTCSLGLYVQIYTQHTNSRALWLFMSLLCQWAANSCSPHTIRWWWKAWRKLLAPLPWRVQLQLVIYSDR